MSPSDNLIHHAPKPKPRRLQRRPPPQLLLSDPNPPQSRDSNRSRNSDSHLNLPSASPRPRPSPRRGFSLRPLSLYRHSTSSSLGSPLSPVTVVSPRETVPVTSHPRPPISPRNLSPFQDDDLGAALAASQLEYDNHQHMIDQREAEHLERARRESHLSEIQRLDINSARLEQERQLIDAVIQHSRQTAQSPTTSVEPYSPLNELEDQLSLDLALALSLNQSSPNHVHHDSHWQSQSEFPWAGYQLGSPRPPYTPDPISPGAPALHSQHSTPEPVTTSPLPHPSAYQPAAGPPSARPDTLRLPVPSYNRLQPAPLGQPSSYSPHELHPRPLLSCITRAPEAAEQPPRPVSSYSRPLPPVPLPTNHSAPSGLNGLSNWHPPATGPDQPAEAQAPTSIQPIFPLPEPSYLAPLPSPSYNRTQAYPLPPQPNPGPSRSRPVSIPAALMIQGAPDPRARPVSCLPTPVCAPPPDPPTPKYFPSKPPKFFPPAVVPDEPAEGDSQTSLPFMFPLAEPTYTRTQLAMRSRHTSTYFRLPPGPPALRQRPASIDVGQPPGSLASSASPTVVRPAGLPKPPRPTVPYRPVGVHATDPFAAAVGPRGRVAALVRQHSPAEDDSSAQLSSSSSCTRSNSTLSANSDVPATPQGGSLRRAARMGRVATETFGANPIAPETVLEGIRYGSLVGLADELSHHGQFPDAFALSRYVRVASVHEKVDAAVFAIEAWSWTRLLTYLMWHGNSRIEAGPLDIAEAADEGWGGWEVSLRVLFRESLAENSVRLVIELVPRGAQAGAGVPGVETRGSATSPEGQQTVVRLPGAQTELPMQLAALAASLHEIHTVATMASCGSRTFRVVHSAKTAHAETLSKFARAISANARARGEVPATAQEEAKLMERGRKWLRAKRMAHHGTAGGKESLEVDGSGLPLPNGATLVQPWDSEWV